MSIYGRVCYLNSDHNFDRIFTEFGAKIPLVKPLDGAVNHENPLSIVLFYGFSTHIGVCTILSSDLEYIRRFFI